MNEALIVFIYACLFLSSTSNALRTRANSNKDDEIPTTKFHVPLVAVKNSHHAYVYIGSPPQQKLVIVDTGSRHLVFPCQPCHQCGKHHYSKSYFDTSLSTTAISNKCSDNECSFSNIPSKNGMCPYANDECHFRQGYTEGSHLKGFEVEDIVFFGTENYEQSIKVHLQTAVPFSFGCETAETGMIANQFADGIVGMISLQQDTVIDMMYREGAIPHYGFSMCMTSNAGTLSIGGTSLKHQHQEQMTFEPLKHGKYYSVKIKSFRVGDIEMKGNRKDFIDEVFNQGKGTIIDSGTTDTYISKAIEKEFKSAWKTITGGKFHNNAHNLSKEQFEKLPNITITLSSGYDWIIQPEQYMEQPKGKVDVKSEWSGTVQFISRIYVDEPEGAVLGSNAMINHDILFDVGNMRLGIARSHCDQ